MGCLGNGSAKAIKNVLESHIETGSVLCTDKSNAYGKLANENKLERVKIDSGRTYKGVYSIQGINAYHAHLKTYMKRFYGVTTKHLNNSLSYYNFIRGVHGGKREQVKTLLDHIIGVKCYTRCVDISARPNIPVAA